MRKSNSRLINSAEIVAVGAELLLGQTVNSDACYLARELSKLGISAYYQQVVGDNHDRLADALNLALSRNDLVITTGGLGPTEDDITMAVAAEVAHRRLLHNDIAEQVLLRYYYAPAGNIPENNWKQTLIPEGATVMPNSNGTASGALIPVAAEDGEKYIAVLPGPPAELTGMFTEQLKPWLEERSQYRFRHRYLRFINIGESAVEQAIKDLVLAQDKVTLATYAAEGEIYLRISERLSREEGEGDHTETVVEEIYRRLGKFIYEDGERDMPTVILDLLRQYALELAVAESCTGGKLASMIVDIPGSSDVFKGGVVSYANAVKESALSVHEETLREHGAVSAETAVEMVTGVGRALSADAAISVTGIAGPGGGSKEKPVGTVYIATAVKGDVDVKRYHLGGDRKRIRRGAALRAMNQLREHILRLADNGKLTAIDNK